MPLSIMDGILQASKVTIGCDEVCRVSESCMYMDEQLRAIKTKISEDRQKEKWDW